MNKYQYDLTTYFILNLLVSLGLFLYFYKTYNQHPILNMILFVLYVFYISHHFIKRYFSFSILSSLDTLRPQMIKDIHEKSNNVAVIIATVFSLLMYLNTSSKYKENKDSLIYATKFILLSLIFGMVLPSLLIHDIDLSESSITKLCIYDTIEFSLETMSILFFIKGLYISYLTL